MPEDPPEGPGTGQGPARLPETGREMVTRTRVSRCRQPGVTLGATGMKNLAVLRTRLDNRKRRARGRELSRTRPDAGTGIYGSATVGPTFGAHCSKAAMAQDTFTGLCKQSVGYSGENRSHLRVRRGSAVAGNAGAAAEESTNLGIDGGRVWGGHSAHRRAGGGASGQSERDVDGSG